MALFDTQRAMTAAGLNMLSQFGSGDRLAFTRAAAGAAVSGGNLSSLTNVTAPQTAMDIAVIQTISSGGRAVTVQKTNAGFSAAQTVKQIGLFASLNGGAEVLFAVAQDPVGVVIPAEADTPSYVFAFDFLFPFSATDDITITVSGAFATAADLTSEIAARQSGDNSLTASITALGTQKANQSDLSAHIGNTAAHVTAADKAKWNALPSAISAFLSNGIFYAADNDLLVSAGSGLAVNVQNGAANICGFVYNPGSGSQSLALAAANASNPRIDRVVIRLTAAAATVALAVVAGAPSANPAAPALTRTAEVYELGIAAVLVPAGAAAPGTITDTRFDTSLCGVVSSLLPTVYA
ncbi:MAG: hypothetical protein LBQ91_01800 [Oscillospiraceae bacterium]|jgi:hypothetical protein|nr:hypothetical protein [Oscillospiraceae bacterium]